MDRMDELIARTAAARKTVQETREVEEAARRARVSTERAYEEAMSELRGEMYSRVDALVPRKEGDRCS